MTTAKIIYTLTDEAPALATYSLLPIVQAFTRSAGIAVETRDISLAGRVIANFPGRSDRAAAPVRRSVGTGGAGEDARSQHHQAAEYLGLAAAAEGRDHGTERPGLPHSGLSGRSARMMRRRKLKTRFAKVLGSAVNPVLREGNSDRRVAKAVKNYAQDPSAFDGRVEAGFADPRGEHERRGFLRQRAGGADRPGRHACASNSPMPAARSRC